MTNKVEERPAKKINGFLALLVVIVVFVLSILAIFQGIVVLGVIGLLIFFVISTGLSIVAPNKAAVVTFFGRYCGTVSDNGIWMLVPFSTRRMVSLRVRNFNSEKLKVNDVGGNPIEIAAVVVFQVVDPARAVFEVDDYSKFVEIQSETALRHVAAKYPYDSFDVEGQHSLRSNADEVSAELGHELQERLAVAGVEVMEARLTHLAYSTEIASAMLQRQQASAILAARQIIVEGAVGMVQLAINQLEKDGTVELDEERRAAMANNLMVAIVSDRSAQPIINTSTLY